jgi:hypothetical protein
MEDALKGALDFVMTDLRPESNEPTNFFELIPVFELSVAEVVTNKINKLEEKDFTKELV